MNNRIEWVDIAKGIGIFLVLLGHTSTSLRGYIYGFHMPLFFFLSGVVFKRGDNKYIGFAKKKFNALINPYIFFYLLTYVYWIAVERNMRSFDIDWWKPILGMFYGSQWNSLMIHNAILWFLPTLFITQLYVYMLGGAKNQLLQWCLVILCAIVGIMIPVNLPWGLNIALVAMQFMFIALLLKNSLSLFSRQSWIIILFVSTFLYITGKYYFHNSVDMAQCKYSNPYLFELFAYLGMLVVISASMLLSFTRNNFLKKILLWLGANTLVLFALHQPVFRIVRFILEHLSSSIDIRGNVLLAIGADIIVLLVLYPIVIVYNNYCRPLLRKLYL